jgi:hypothetical protein
MAEKKTPFGGKQAAPFGKGGKREEKKEEPKKATKSAKTTKK